MKKPASIVVYANPLSPYVNKVRAFLNVKGLEYQVRYVNPLNKSELEFSGQGKVPVLTVDDEVLVDSTPICLRIEELFPSVDPLVPSDPERRSKTLRIDQWVTEALIPTNFYASQKFPLITKLFNGWLSGRIHSQTSPEKIPLLVRMLWPVFVVRATFVPELIEHIDHRRSVEEVCKEAALEFVQKLEGGPFLGGEAKPTLADCAAFGHFLPGYMGGMKGYDEFMAFPEIRDWLRRMTPLAYAPKPFWPKELVRRDPVVSFA